MAAPCPGGGLRLSEALDSMQLAYNPITKQLHFVSPKPDKPAPAPAPAEDTADDLDKLSKKSSFSDEGNFSISTCEKSDTSDSPKSTLNWGGSVSGHQRGKDGGSFSSTVSSLSECSLGSSASKEDEPTEETSEQEQAKLKKKGLSGFFSRGVFPWKSNSSSKESPAPAPAPAPSWRLFGRGGGTAAAAAGGAPAPAAEPAPAALAPAPQHRRQGSAASDKQFEELVASSIALIQHDRPSNLPAKTTEEAQRHRAEHARILEAARRRVEREAAARAARTQRALRHEERLARHAREWAAILPLWPAQKNTKRTQELWWSGLPPSVRGRVWQLAIGNRLGVTPELYRACAERARQRLQAARLRRSRLKLNRACDCHDKPQDKERLGLTRNFSEQNLKSQAAASKCCSRSNPDLVERGDESPMELISLDIARTFPALGIFQPGGPYYSALHELLAAYACYRPDVGYVQGMSFIAAMLILNMEGPAAFVCFANLLDGPVLRAAYTRDGHTMQRLWAAYSRLLEHNLPALAASVPAPELYLLEWLYTAFAKAMPLDAACRVWDVFLRDGDAFLFNTALGILHLYQSSLAEMDFISAAQFLTRLPDELDAEALFRSIAAVSMSRDGLSFDQLVERAAPSMDDDDSRR